MGDVKWNAALHSAHTLECFVRVTLHLEVDDVAGLGD